nr:ribokinase [uncultured Draconibacterium sp.]
MTENTQKITVVGSTNTDMVIKAQRLPLPGETILGGSFFMAQGGKGANQAVAVSRLGGQLTFVAKTGADIFGKNTRDILVKDGIDVKYILEDKEKPTGVALIMVDKQAENSISVASGANAKLLPDDFNLIPEVIEDADIILMQLEIPLETVEFVATIAHALGKKVILNPAPGCHLPKSLLEKLYLLTPNETEAELISGIKVSDIPTAKDAAKQIHSMGVTSVIITMGAKGALIYSENQFVIVPAISVDAIDTTAAGDVFNGALAVALSKKESLVNAAGFASKAAAISVTRMGAQPSVPYLNEVN